MPSSDPGFAPGSVVRVPFPYSDAETRQHRPALVVATAGPQGAPLVLWVLMITSVANRGWAGDIEIPDAAAAGLPIPSVIRTAKIATIDLGRAQPRGRIDPRTLDAVRAELTRRLGL
jgi:mRNA interferase MazF